MNRQYLYTLYQRVWHWLQAFVLLTLILSGLEIHLPQSVHLIGFREAVRAHNFMGFVLLGNAFLGFFYYLTTGELRQLIPQARNLLGGLIAQARYYGYGIFHHAPHPHQKRPESRLNPLQRLTYTMVLNVLLPLQLVTGLMIWSAQNWPDSLARIGGLAALAYVHSLGAWLFCAFLILHLYLITTGPTPTAHLRSMLTGWDTPEPQTPLTEAPRK